MSTRRRSRGSERLARRGVELEQLAGETPAEPCSWRFGEGAALVVAVHDDLAARRPRGEAFHETVLRPRRRDQLRRGSGRGCARSSGRRLTRARGAAENPSVLRRDAKVELLKKVPLFAGLSGSELRKIAAVADEYNLREGRTLTREGDRIPRDFVIILDGSARVERKGRVVNRLGAGGFFGEVALVTNQPRTATVTAETPIHALVLRERDFRRVLKTTPAVTMKILQALARRLPHDEL